MEYAFQSIEQKWREFWKQNQTYTVLEDKSKPKYYILDMFPYPSGAGLHVGHPLGYIASDIFARYKKLQGFNVLHPMGYDSFGLPAEQYAIQTGQHPAITTEQNIARYRDQLDKIGFCYDWSREVRTSSPEYYKWTQWIFKQVFASWYDSKQDKARPIADLISTFEKEGNKNIEACSDFDSIFTSEDWNSYDAHKKEAILQEYRLAYLADSWVNWCPALGTVLANDEVVNGVSERGGHPVEQKKMRQWSMRIKAYADRLITGLDKVDWTDSIKDMQRHWIGKSVGASVFFAVDRGLAQSGDEGIASTKIENELSDGHTIEVFTTRPDTIYGVSFMVLAPEHPLVSKITSKEQKEKVEQYIRQSALKSERDRQSDVKNITGEFTGAYALHPFTGAKLPIWIGDYVLASYGTGAVMSVPCGDERDYDFAKHFEIPIPNIFKDIDISESAYSEKEAIIANSDFLNDLPVKEAMKKAIDAIVSKGIGKGRINYRLRDAIFSRQRYWGEPFPVYFENDLPKLVADEDLPIVLPDVDAYLPTEDGEPPLARAKKESWEKHFGDRMEFNTMPGWAGSSWYFLRYMDPKNETEFVSKEKVDYWKNVDLYIGGSEHATGHLLYSRFWTKFLFDLGYIPFDEPFQKMINQGMILGRSSFVYRSEDNTTLVTASKRKTMKTTPIHVDISIVDNDKLDIEAFKKWRPEFANAEFILEEDGTYLCGHEVEKMSKSKYNVQTPDELVDKFGADTLRMYEMFLGPLEQSKPWDTKGISGVHNFLRKLWRLFHDEGNMVCLTNDEPSKDNLKTLHKTIKKIGDDLERFSFNTGVSNFMICVNELTEQKCNNRTVLKELIILLSPYAPHIAEELWVKLGEQAGTVSHAEFPKFNEEHLIESNFSYPVSFNGKMRLKVDLALTLSAKEVEQHVMALPDAIKWMEGKQPKKVIVVPGKIVNIVL
ncbi:MAG: leucine--tRNA ligase [Bacteroidetes bacterium]|nr:leucine--tRNA ligase [Bacteroidota bacterium]